MSKFIVFSAFILFYSTIYSVGTIQGQQPSDHSDAVQVALAQVNPKKRYYTVQLASCATEQQAVKLYSALLPKLPEELLDFLRIERVAPYVTIRTGRARSRKDILALYDHAKKFTEPSIIWAYIKEERIVQFNLAGKASLEPPEVASPETIVPVTAPPVKEEPAGEENHAAPAQSVPRKAPQASLSKPITAQEEQTPPADEKAEPAVSGPDQPTVLPPVIPAASQAAEPKPGGENLQIPKAQTDWKGTPAVAENEESATATAELPPELPSQASHIKRTPRLPMLSEFLQNSTPAEPESNFDMVLSESEFVKLVLEKNEYISSQGLEWAISQDAVENSKSIFELEFVASHEHNDRTFLNEDWTRAFFSGSSESTVVNEVSKEYSLALQGLTPLGSEIQLGHTLQERANDLELVDGNEFKGFLGVSILQPLMRDAGTKVTKANISVSEIESKIAYQGYRKKMAEVVANALGAFWSLRQAQETVFLREKSVSLAERILADNQLRVEAGSMAATQIYLAQAGVLTRKAHLYEAQQQQVANVAKLKTFISYMGEKDGRLMKVIGDIGMTSTVRDFDQSLEMAKKYRPEYLIAMKKMKKEDVRIDYAKNQTLPRLDLSGTYGLSSIEDNASDAFHNTYNNQYNSWSVGLELTIPMQGGRKTKSELSAAQHRKQQASLEVSSIEVALANDVGSALKNVDNIEKQAKNYAQVVELNKKLLTIEIARMQSGKSNSREVLQKEEDLNEVREAELNNSINHKKALLALGLMEGTLLSRYNIDEKEVQQWQ